jgi:hypothetical protein
MSLLGGFWGRAVGIAALLLPVVAYALTWSAADTVRRRAARAPGRRPRLRRRVRGRIAGPVALAVFLGALWACAVVRATFAGGTADGAAEGAGHLLGAYLPLCAGLAAVVWFRAREPEGGASLVAAGAVGAALAGAWPEYFGYAELAAYGVGEPVFTWLGGLWGGNAFWGSLLLVLPAVVGGVLVLRDRPV